MTEAGTVSRVVGFIGLGAMGRPMVGALIEAGMDVVVHDLSADALDAAGAAGARPAASAAEVATRTDVVFTMLPFAEDVELALIGPDGAAGGAHAGSVFVDASTIDPMSLIVVARALSDQGIDSMDAAVSGSPQMVRERRATVLVGGGPSLFSRCRPVLEALGGTLVHTGALGTAKVVKLANNLVGAVSMAAVAEAFNLAMRAGVDPAVLHRAMSGSMGNCHALQVRPPAPGLVQDGPADHDFAPDFSVDFMAKDLAYALRTADARGAALPIASLARDLYVATSARGDGGLDFSAVFRTVQAMSGPEGAGDGRQDEGDDNKAGNSS
jgi:3-hydroxyisobutyrate dehydrogenase